jgi:eukaryotic-like serine/threonine-protein kinase
LHFRVLMLSGEVLDRFLVKGPLARGGMGELWLADDEDERDVVLKTVREDLLDDDEVRTSFRREIEIHSVLDHAHIVRHIANGWHDGVEVMALEHIPSRSLAEMRNVRMPIGAALCIARDIAEALAYVHNVVDVDGTPLGLVHGDVSPQNILIDTDGFAHLIDFGAVKMSGESTDEGIIGKPGYMSPEQSRADRLDERSDQYSLGIVLWEMLTGRDLFEGSAARRGRKIPPLSRYIEAPDALEDAVLRMLSFEEDARFTSIAKASRELSSFIKEPTAQHRAWLAQLARRPRRQRELEQAWRGNQTRPLSPEHQLAL